MQYQKDHDDYLTKSNSVVFNTFIFMQVGSACSQLNTMRWFWVTLICNGCR